MLILENSEVWTKSFNLPCDGVDDIGGVTNNNCIFFLKSCLRCQILAGVEFSYDDELLVKLSRMVMRMKMLLTRILQRW